MIRIAFEENPEISRCPISRIFQVHDATCISTVHWTDLQSRHVVFRQILWESVRCDAFRTFARSQAHTLLQSPDIQTSYAKTSKSSKRSRKAQMENPTMDCDYSRQNLHKDKKCQRRWNLPWVLALKATGARTRLRTNAEVAAHNRCFCTWWSWVVSDILAPHIPWHPSEPSTSS